MTRAALAPPVLVQSTSEVHARRDTLIVRTDGIVRVLALDDVAWIETEGNYLRIHTAGGALLARGSATRLELQLDPRRFARIHRRYLVNLRRLHEIRPLAGGDASVRLRDGTTLRLSRTYRERFFARFLRDAT
jgi:two-component system, LytTR family, response regulator